MILEFNAISIADKDKIESISKGYPPYSDFVFSSIWSWNTEGRIRVAYFLEEAFIIESTDYISGDAIYFYLVSAEVKDSLVVHEKILQLLKSHSIYSSIKVKYIPKEYVNVLKKLNYTPIIDCDHRDYLYNLNDFLTFSGNKFRSKRNQLLRFKKLYEDFVNFEIYDFSSRGFNFAKDHLLKIQATGNNEQKAVNRSLRLMNDAVYLLVINIKDSPSAICIVEKQNEYLILHFIKTKRDLYIGIVPYVKHLLAKIFLSKGVKYMNYEQDLGLENLRKAKRQYKPFGYLDKYMLELHK